MKSVGHLNSVVVWRTPMHFFSCRVPETRQFDRMEIVTFLSDANSLEATVGARDDDRRPTHALDRSNRVEPVVNYTPGGVDQSIVYATG